MPIVAIPRQFNLRLPDGGEINFPGPGRYNVDDTIASHPLMVRLVVPDDVIRVAAPNQAMAETKPLTAVRPGAANAEGLTPEARAALQAGDVGHAAGLVPGHTTAEGNTPDHPPLDVNNLPDRTAEALDLNRQAEPRSRRERLVEGEEAAEDKAEAEAAEVEAAQAGDPNDQTGTDTSRRGRR